MASIDYETDRYREEKIKMNKKVVLTNHNHERFIEYVGELLSMRETFLFGYTLVEIKKTNGETILVRESFESLLKLFDILELESSPLLVPLDGTRQEYDGSSRISEETSAEEDDTDE